MQIEWQCLSVPRLLLPSPAAPCPAHPVTRASGAHVLVEAERAAKGPKDLAAKQLQGVEWWRRVYCRWGGESAAGGTCVCSAVSAAGRHPPTPAAPPLTFMAAPTAGFFLLLAAAPPAPPPVCCLRVWPGGVAGRGCSGACSGHVKDQRGSSQSQQRPHSSQHQLPRTRGGGGLAAAGSRPGLHAHTLAGSLWEGRQGRDRGWGTKSEW